MRYLVAGGLGFLGSHLCERLLEQGHDVVCADSGVIGNERNIAGFADHPNLDVTYCDLTHTTDFGKIDGIYALASPTAPAETYKHSKMTLEVNSNGILKLLCLAEKYKAKFLFASSVKVKDILTFGSSYIQGKLLGEKFCDNGWAKVCRMGNIYGPRMAPDDSRVIPTFCRNLRDGKPLSIWGDGSQIDSFCYVSDMINGMIRFMESPAIGTIEFGSPAGITILDLAYMCIQTIGVDVPILFEQPGGGMVAVSNNLSCANNRTTDALKGKSRKVPDILMSQKCLNWSPKIPLEEGIKRTFEYYQNIGGN